MSYNLLSKYRSELMGFAMLLLLFFHTFELRIGSPVLNAVRSLCYCGVDIFIFLSAVGLSMSLSSKKRSYGEYLRRRFARILPAAYIVMAPFLLWQLSRGTGTWSGILHNCLFVAYWIDPATCFNWYLTGILLLYAAAPPLHALISRSRHALALTLALSLAAIAGYMLLIRLGVWNYLDIIYRVPVFLLGLLVGIYITKQRRFGRADAAVCAVMAALGALLLFSPLHMPFYVPPCLAFFLLMPPLCLTLAYLMDRLPSAAPRAVLRFIGGSSLEIYLINVVFVVKAGFFHTLLPFGPSNRLFYLVLYLANILLGWLLHLLIESVRGVISRRRLISRT